jgi:hypothetical protein
VRYFPEKLGYVFCEGTERDRADKTKIIANGTAFKLACNIFGQEVVTNEVTNCMMIYCVAATTSPSTMKSSLLMLTVTDESIHLDGLYILLRKDPIAALLRMEQQLLCEDEQTDDDNGGGNNNTEAATSIT